MEIIGHLRPFGQAPSEDIHSRCYDTLGNTLDYVYELDEVELFNAIGEGAFQRGEVPNPSCK